MRVLPYQVQICLCLFLLLAAVAPVAAQRNEGVIAGAAYDAATGKGLPQVQVEVDGPVSVRGVTDLDGKFQFKLPPGTYAVRFTSPHHLPASLEGIELPEWPAIRRWFARLADRPAYRKHVMLPLS